MARLEDIPKKQGFKVPDGYFDDLPLRIQARIEAKNPVTQHSSSFGKLALRYALPVLLLGTVSIVWWANRSESGDPISALNSVPASELVAYLENEGVTSDEILEHVSLSGVNLDEMEKPYENLSAQDLEDIANEYDIKI